MLTAAEVLTISERLRDYAQTLALDPVLELRAQAWALGRVAASLRTIATAMQAPEPHGRRRSHR